MFLSRISQVSRNVYVTDFYRQKVFKMISLTYLLVAFIPQMKKNWIYKGIYWDMFHNFHILMNLLILVFKITMTIITQSNEKSRFVVWLRFRNFSRKKQNILRTTIRYDRLVQRRLYKISRLIAYRTILYCVIVYRACHEPRDLRFCLSNKNFQHCRGVHIAQTVT